MSTENNTFNWSPESLVDPVAARQERRQTLQSILSEAEPVTTIGMIKTAINNTVKDRPDYEVEYPVDMKWGALHMAGYKNIIDTRRSYSSISGGIDSQITEWADCLNQVVHRRTIKSKITFKQNPNSKKEFTEKLASYLHLSINGAFIGVDEKNIIETIVNINEPSEGVFDNVNISSRSLEKYEAIKALFAEYMVLHSSGVAITVIDSVGPGGLKTRDINIEDDEKFSNSTFYPWMKGTTIEEYFSDFLDSDANLMLLYGPPGTAKTTMVKTAVKKLGLSAVMSANANVTSDGGFVTSLINYLEVERPGTDLILLEDADALIRPRDEGNLGLNALLSFLDGIGSTKVKLVIITNQENCSNIDTALLRHGRCYDMMEFGRLTREEGEAARKSIGMPPFVGKSFNNMTLAQALVDNGRDSVRAARNENHSIVSPRFPIAKPSK